MDYPIKTLSQLRPILQGFRKAGGYTQAGMAEKLGITQQSYAQLEANPATASVERLHKVLSVLGVEILLSVAVQSSSSPNAHRDVAAPAATYTGKTTTSAKKESW